MLKTFTCIVCPNGCEIEARSDNGAEISLTGAGCQKGEDYVRQELTDPRRNLATSIAVRGGELPLASVRLTAPIPKARIFDAVEEIRKLSVDAPVKAGTIMLHGILGFDSDVIVTKSVEKRIEED